MRFDGVGVFNRIGLFAVITLIVVAVLFHYHRAHERLVQELLDSSRSVVDRTLLLDQALGGLHSDQARELLAALSSAQFRADLSNAPPEPDPDPWRHSQEVEALLLPWLTEQAPDGARLSFSVRRSASGRGPGEPWLAVALRHGEDQWLVVQSRLTLLEGPAFLRVSWSLTGLLLLVLIILWVSRRLQRPLNRLAAAADRLGEHLDAPPMPVRGSREVRRATAAFNAMQARLQGQLHERTTMLAALSHDLRTLLTRLRLSVDLPDSEDRRSRLHHDIDAMTTMLETTLAWARGHEHAEAAREIDVAALCQTLVDEQQDNGIDSTYAGPARLVLRTQATALQRALMNLVENAARYAGNVELELRNAANGVQIEVRDRGPGIPAEQREDAFEPFERLDAARNQSSEGSGLGLAIVRAVIESLGGRVALDDRPGGGLIARVDLPRGNAPQATR